MTTKGSRKETTRRKFLGAAGGAAIGMSAASAANGKLAVMGGTPVRTAAWPTWPKIGRTDEETWMGVLRSERWNLGRGKQLEKFQESYCRLTGAKYCLATANGVTGPSALE